MNYLFFPNPKCKSLRKEYLHYGRDIRSFFDFHPSKNHIEPIGRIGKSLITWIVICMVIFIFVVTVVMKIGLEANSKLEKVYFTFFLSFDGSSMTYAWFSTLGQA